MEEEQRNERNKRRRKAYAEMNADKKAAFHERRRVLYAERAGKSSETPLPNENIASRNFETEQPSNNTGLSNLRLDFQIIGPEIPQNANSTGIMPQVAMASSSYTASACRKAYIDEAMYPSARFNDATQNDGLLSHQNSDNDSPLAAMLPTVPDCKYCAANRFYREPPGFCCSKGEIRIAPSEMPSALVDLFTGSDPESVDFKKYVRSYNNNLAFTTFSAKTDRDLMRNHMGVYTFKVQGKIHHYLGSFGKTGDVPSALELYFYDEDTQLEERLKLSKRVSKVIMRKLIEILSENPYVRFLKQVRDLESVDNYQICLVTCPILDQRVYNEPTCNDVSAIIFSESEEQFNPTCHIQIYEKNAVPHKICHYFGCYDGLQYPLLFPRGDVGWHNGIQKLPPNKRKRNYRCKVPLEGLINTVQHADELIREEEEVARECSRKRNTVSCRQYYCYKLQKRANDRSILLHTGRLLQQYIVDMFVKVETSRLEYLEKQQREIRTDCLQGLLDSIAVGHTSTSEVGRKTILPPTFIGGPRDMKKRYMDAMCLVQNFGKPDFFLTMTCNSAWPEITEHLITGELPQNRPDLLTRVFKAKLEMLKTELLKDHIFGLPVAFVYSIEFQKRGLPHAHVLLIVDRDSKPLNPDAYDRYISAELPDPLRYPHLHRLFLKHMVHGPCGPLNPKCPCMRDKRCKNKYPKEFSQYTTHGSNSYPHYRRRNNGINARVRGHEIDNRWIVPYNPYLLQKYNCHINVEICSTIKLVKYIYKYIYKGPDKISFHMSTFDCENEIREYQKGRWVGPPEAAWRLFSFDLFEMHPAVIPLQLHLPNNYLVSFSTNQDINSIVTNNFLSRTMLTQFFQMNRTNSIAMNLKLLYKDFPKHFVWDSTKRAWAERKRGKVVGRIVSVSPTEGERYYLRLLLNHISAPTSFDDLLTVDGYLHCTFRESALRRNLLTTDYDLDKCLEEASMYQMPRQLRHLFVSILVFCSPSDPRKLWEKYKEPLCDDYLQGILCSSNITDAQMKALVDIAVMLDDMGKKLEDYRLGPEAEAIARQGPGAREMAFEKSLTVDETDLLNIHSFNEQQRYAFEQIMAKVASSEATAFFVDGPGGTGKTFLYRAILATIRSKGHIALATASSGVAACVLPGGRTAHSRFKLPLQEEQKKIANVSKQSTTATLLREAKVIIWDEAPMAHRESIEAFSEMLKDITETNSPFGNKIVVFGGDFRQVLPVVTNASRQEQLDASLISSLLWPVLHKIRLTQNMRAIADPAFTEYLLRIGDGTEPEDDNGNVQLPINMLIPFHDKETSLRHLIQFVYPDIEAFATNHHTVMNSALLAPTNECVQDINDEMLQQMPGELITYISSDVALDRSHQADYEDFLNSLTPASLPPHELMLKVNSPVMLLRNLSPVQGLCNGTRLLCKELKKHTIVAEIATGPFAGKQTILHKIPLQNSNIDKCAIPFKRYQYPIRLCFAMTINKAQGQTLDHFEPKILMATLLHIDDITPQTENWRVKVFILQKSNVYTNETGRRLQKLLLQDEQGKKIEGVIWNTNIELLDGNLTPFSTYVIGGADVDTIKEEYKHNSPGQQYQWLLSRTTFIRAVKDHDQMIPCPPIQSTPFSSLRSHVNTGAPVDILAVVVDVKETRYVPVRSKLVPLRECIVMQNELKPITVMLWGDYGHKQGAELFRLRNELPIVLCKGLKASPFSGISLSTLHFSFVAVEPDIIEAKLLRSWVKDHEDVIKKAAGATVPNYLETVSDKTSTVEITPLSQIQPDSKIIHAEVTLAITDVDQKMCYTVCPKCFGTQKAMPNELFTCSSCQQDFNALPRCKITAQVTDSSRTINVTFFDKCASKLLRKSPEDLQKEDKQATTKLLLNINEQLHSKKLIMEIKATKKKFTDKITRYTVLDWIVKNQASGSVDEEAQMCSQSTVDSGITTVSPKGKHLEEIESTTKGSDTEQDNTSSSSTPQKKQKKSISETTLI